MLQFLTGSLPKTFLHLVWLGRQDDPSNKDKFPQVYINGLKVTQNSFQYLDFNGSFLLDATIMVSQNYSIIGEHVIFFVTQ